MPHVHGAAAIAYRLYDVGYAIDLPRALDLLAASGPERVRPVRGEAQALQISNPPITVVLGSEIILLGESGHAAEVSARIFDFGVVSLRVRFAAASTLSWEDFTAFARRLEHHPGVLSVIEHHLRLLTERIAPAVERPVVADVHEDYTVFRVSHITKGPELPPGNSGAEGGPDVNGMLPQVLAESLAQLDVAPLLLSEVRPLSVEARRELLPHRFSYYADDLAVLAWESALIVEPGSHDTDVQYILEFANAQLLELRYYDALLDQELPRLYDAIERARARRAVFPGRRFGALLAELQQRVADSTELVERVENALKVTDDVYLARIYSAALELFRGKAWRAGIDRKLAILRDTYAMLNGEAQAARSETLEIAIVALIVVEVIMGLTSG